jgi:hypothetical protein
MIAIPGVIIYFVRISKENAIFFSFRMRNRFERGSAYPTGSDSFVNFNASNTIGSVYLVGTIVIRNNTNSAQNATGINISNVV